MKVSLKEIKGPWDQGWALDKHTISSTYMGDDEWGHPRFDTVRTEVGEATFQLKYRQDWSQVKVLAQALEDNIYSRRLSDLTDRSEGLDVRGQIYGKLRANSMAICRKLP